VKKSLYVRLKGQNHADYFFDIEGITYPLQICPSKWHIQLRILSSCWNVYGSYWSVAWNSSHSMNVNIEVLAVGENVSDGPQFIIEGLEHKGYSFW